jgi:hypothetical protein
LVSGSLQLLRPRQQSGFGRDRSRDGTGEDDGFWSWGPRAMESILFSIVSHKPFDKKIEKETTPTLTSHLEQTKAQVGYTQMKC